MKKSIIFFTIASILFCTVCANAQEKTKKTTDTAQVCKPTKAGKHCATPVKKSKQ